MKLMTARKATKSLNAFAGSKRGPQPKAGPMKSRGYDMDQDGDSKGRDSDRDGM